MIEKITHVKNPLTIIAIFAGLSEISGTIVLPFLNEGSQSLFVYFLIFLPVLLVVLFFITLNFNHTVLYAPSDYQNEDNFVKLFSQASLDEVISGKLLELTNNYNGKNLELKKEKSENTIKNTAETAEITNTIVADSLETFTVGGNPLSQDEIEKYNIYEESLGKEFLEKYSTIIMRNIREESRGISYIENTRGIKFQRNAKFLGLHDSYIFDGVYISQDKIIVTEITNWTPQPSKIRYDFKKALYIFNNLPESEKYKFEFIYFIIFSEKILEENYNIDKYMDSINIIKSEFPFETSIMSNKNEYPYRKYYERYSSDA